MVKKIAEKFNRLSRVHQRHKQTTDSRQTTDGRLIAYSERNVVRSLKRKSQTSPKTRQQYSLSQTVSATVPHSDRLRDLRKHSECRNAREF